MSSVICNKHHSYTLLMLLMCLSGDVIAGSICHTGSRRQFF